ncbi:MAG: starch synthase [Polaribacter sp.]|jgi:starch synthase
MEILHISAECYPAAKAGGLGDVVGSLPKYLNKAGAEATVIIPKYSTKWLNNQSYKTLYQGSIDHFNRKVGFRILEVEKVELGFSLYVADLPGLYDREGIYVGPGGAYSDESERAIYFQEAILQWILQMENRPDILHCHDHHCALIPFIINYCPDYRALHKVPTVFTIHNGEYQGAFSWNRQYLLPPYYKDDRGLLDWKSTINPMAAAVKCCWRLTTVSQGYMDELRQESNGLGWLFNSESGKSKGIMNGIDTEVWDPKKDKLIAHPMKRSLATFKKKNKEALREYFHIEGDLPIITFIGRLVGEKGADLLPELISRFLQSGGRATFLLLGTGEPKLEAAFREMKQRYAPYFDARLEYNEKIAHQLYAGSDFLLMPSRVEPCGLNQLYALRYGTIPMVRNIGGLKDSISDIGFENGYGITFDHYSVSSAFSSLARAAQLYADQKTFDLIRKRTIALDFSWEKSAKEYMEIYESML